MENIHEKERRTLIFVPFAFDPHMRTGSNMEKQRNAQDIYLKNCCVSLVSAKHYNPDCTVALVTNLEPPEKYVRELEHAGVAIMKIPFTEFRFNEEMTWGLAFYKLCALYQLVKQGDYAYYIWLDCDVYVQDSIRALLPELDQNILLWDHMHGLQNAAYVEFLKEVWQFQLEGTYITHYGGEFFATNLENGRRYMEEARAVFQQIKERNIIFNTGDELITSITAHRTALPVKNAGAYLFRFSTGPFRLISSRYRTDVDPVMVLHVPAEKNTGMVALYDRYISKGKIPSRKTVWRLLHLSHWGMVNRCKYIAKKILKKH